MPESNNQKFNHLKIHSQYSICEGAIKIDNLKDFCKEKRIQSIGLSDTSNLCGALEFAENISKVGTQPIIGTQINFKHEDTTGLIPLIALNEDGYKRIVELSSKSYLENDALSEPHCNLSELYKNAGGILVLSGSIKGFFGKLFDKGRFSEIDKIYQKVISNFKNSFYLEIQRHGDLNEKIFEKYNLQKSNEFKNFMDAHEDGLTDEFNKENHFQTCVRGLKIRGCYSTQEEAELRCKMLREVDPNHDIYVGQVGVWMPWDPEAYKTGKVEYLEEELNQLMNEKNNV